MEPSTIFRLRAELLKKRLDALEKLIVSGAAKSGWAEGRFQSKIDELRESPSALPDGGLPNQGDWAALQSREGNCDRLFQEALAFLCRKGKLCIEPRLDNLATSLVERLNACWFAEPPLIVPDLMDSYSDFVPIIRMRFPAAGLWDVPVLAHELGHHVAYRISSDSPSGIERPRPLADLIKRYLDKAEQEGKPKEEKQKIEHWMNEFFADMFATYVMGFAFAASLLLLRFDLSSPYRSGGRTHPSPAARARVVLYTVKRMSKDMSPNKGAKGSMDRPLNWLSSCWRKLVGQDKGGELTDDFLDNNKGFCGELYLATKSMAEKAMYNGWSHVEEYVLFALDPNSNVARTPVEARDLLNGAWLWLTETADAACVEGQALEWWADSDLRK